MMIFDPIKLISVSALRRSRVDLRADACLYEHCSRQLVRVGVFDLHRCFRFRYLLVVVNIIIPPTTDRSSRMTHEGFGHGRLVRACVAVRLGSIPDRACADECRSRWRLSTTPLSASRRSSLTLASNSSEFGIVLIWRSRLRGSEKILNLQKFRRLLVNGTPVCDCLASHLRSMFESCCHQQPHLKPSFAAVRSPPRISVAIEAAFGGQPSIQFWYDPFLLNWATAGLTLSC